MNVNDTEIATSILTASGYKMTNNIEEVTHSLTLYDANSNHRFPFSRPTSPS